MLNDDYKMPCRVWGKALTQGTCVGAVGQAARITSFWSPPMGGASSSLLAVWVKMDSQIGMGLSSRTRSSVRGQLGTRRTEFCPIDKDHPGSLNLTCASK